MWKSKKFIILTSVLAIALLFGATVGIALAQAGDNGKGTDQHTALMARVAQLLGKTQQEVSDAFKKAMTELKAQNPRPQRSNQSMDQWLDKLVQDKKITHFQTSTRVGITKATDREWRFFYATA